jgi:N-acetylglucosamine-6-phosphate deacetylase
LTVLRAGRVLWPDGTTGPGSVEFDGPRIERVTAGGSGSGVIAPGFIDLQVNGHGRTDVATADGSAWDELDAVLLSQGVTAWCPTVISAPPAAYGDVLARINAAAQRPPRRPRPTIVGVHLEGPFIGGAVGAHPTATPVDLAWLAGLPPLVRIVTLAPEVPGALEAIATLVSAGKVVALGHSTATYEEAETAVAGGARMVTHVFNAMTPFHHRAPGLAGAALTDDRLTVSVIADGVHLSAAVVALVFRAKPRGGVVLITDAVAWRAPAARDRGIRVRDGAPSLPDGTLAGTALTMDAAVRNAVGAGIALDDALVAASAAPAAVAGLHGRGRLSAGSSADVVVLTDDLEVDRVFAGGQLAWCR